MIHIFKYMTVLIAFIAVPAMGGWNPLVLILETSPDKVAKGDTVTITPTFKDGTEAEVSCDLEIIRLKDDSTTVSSSVSSESSYLWDTTDVDGGYYKAKAKASENDAWIEASITVYEVKIESKVEFASESEYAESGTEILAGGLDDDMHRASIKITFTPNLGGDNNVSVRFITESGGGHEFNETWKQGPAIPTTFASSSGGTSLTNTYGDGNTTWSNIYDNMQGALRSSNKVETGTLRVTVAGLPVAVSAEHEISFEPGIFEVDFDDDVIVPEVWEDATVTYKFRNRHIVGHEIGVGIAKVVFVDGNVIDAKGITLESYVEIDGDGFETKYDDQTSAGAPMIFKARTVDQGENPNVAMYEFVVGDLDVRDDSE